jgi:hypothetical protein
MPSSKPALSVVISTGSGPIRHGLAPPGSDLNIVAVRPEVAYSAVAGGAIRTDQAGQAGLATGSLTVGDGGDRRPEHDDNSGRLVITVVISARVVAKDDVLGDHGEASLEVSITDYGHQLVIQPQPPHWPIGGAAVEDHAPEEIPSHIHRPWQPLRPATGRP